MVDDVPSSTAAYLVNELVTSFSPQQYSDAISDYVESVLDLFNLSKEHRSDVKKLLHKQASSVIVPGKYEVSRIVVTQLKPEIDNKAFIAQLEKNNGHEIVVSMQNFVDEFNTKYPLHEQHSAEERTNFFHTFVGKTCTLLADWKIDHVDECVESYLTTSLFDSQFPKEPTREDMHHTRRINGLQFIKYEHLEIPRDTQERVAWSYAQEALQKIQLQKTPCAKVNCIFECFKIIAQGLTDAGHNGADDLLPCVIYTLLKANIPLFHSNLNYINTFRSPDEMGSQSGYFCVTMFAAAMFIENLTSEQLTIDREFFISQMASLSESTEGMLVVDDDPEPHGPREKDLEAYMAEASISSLTISDSMPALQETPKPILISPRSPPQSYAPIFKDEPEASPMPKRSVQAKKATSSILPLSECLQGVELEPIFLALIAVAVAHKMYDARIRVALRRMARKLGVAHNAFLKLEESFVRSLAAVQNKPNTPSTAASFRIAKVLLAATAGGAVVALTGGLAAPLVGHLFGVMGLSALATALTTTTGVSGVAFVGILCGATVTGGQMARKTAGLEEFDFLRVQVKRVLPKPPSPISPRKSNKSTVLDSIKQGWDELLIKGKKITSPKEKPPQEEKRELLDIKHTETVAGANDVGESETTNNISSGDAAGVASAIGESSKDNTAPVDTQPASVAAGQVENGEGELVVYTEHSHGEKKSEKQAESLIVGTQNTFKGLHTIIGVPGWGNRDKDECVCDIWARAIYNATEGFGDSFVLMWESQYLKKIGTDLRKFGDHEGTSDSLATKVAQKMMYHSLLSTTVLQEIAMVDSPWMLVRDRAEKAGILLAHSLLNGSLGARPATLVGVSMGARVIFHCLEELCKLQDTYNASKGTAKGDNQNKKEEKGKEKLKEKDKKEGENANDLPDKRDPASVIENVILIGAAVPSDMLRFTTARRLVAGRFVNCYNPNDYTLSVIYRIVHWIQDGIHPPAGVAPVPSHPRSTLLIENVNIEALASSHMDYQNGNVLSTILEAVASVF